MQKYLIVGLGSIGKRHLSNLLKLKPDAQVMVLRLVNRNKADLGGSVEGNISFTYSIEEAIEWKPECALICSPASTHIDIALKLAEAKIHLFIEKPLSINLANVEALRAKCQRHNLKMVTAYNFRFCESGIFFRNAVRNEISGKVLQVLIDMGQYLPDWRPNQDYRKGVSARAELGGGAILELSHELDYIRWIFGEIDKVFTQSNMSGVLDVDVEDSFDCLMRTHDNVPINLHADFLQRKAFRQCKVICEQGTLTWDVLNKKVFLSDPAKDELLYEVPNLDRNDMYLYELKTFLSSLSQPHNNENLTEDGIDTLKLIIAIKKSAAKEQVVKVESYE